MSHRVLAVCIALLMVVLSTASWTAGQESDSQLAQHTALLKQHGVSTDTDNLLQFLARLTPDDKLQTRVEALIEQLGSTSFAAREQATRDLEQLGEPARNKLLASAKSEDGEVAWRSEHVLRKIADADNLQRKDALTLAALKLLKHRKAAKAAPALITVLAVLKPSHLQDAASEALWASVAREHRDLLRTSLRHDALHVRAAALVSLEIASGKESVATVQPYLDNPHDELRLAAARALVNHQPRRCLPALVRLLESKNRQMRNQSRFLLKAISGQKEDGADEVAAVKHWQEWAAESDDLARLRLPLGAVRLELSGGYGRFVQTFTVAQASVTDAYQQMKYETNIGAKAAVRDGRLVLDGQHAEDGDQILYVPAKVLTGGPKLPYRFTVSIRLGGQQAGAGTYHVGVIVGGVKVLFHAAYPGGAFRAERTPSREYLFPNEDMPFTPAADKLHEMAVKVTRAEDAVRFEIAVTNADNPKQTFRRTFQVKPDDVGPFDRIGLVRSGRTGGEAYFGSLTIQTQ